MDSTMSNLALTPVPLNPKKAKEKLDFLLNTTLSKIDELQTLIKKESSLIGQDVSQPLIPILRRQEDIMSNVYKLKLPGPNMASGGSSKPHHNNISPKINKEGVNESFIVGNSSQSRRYNQNLQAGQFGGSLPRRSRTKEPHLRADQRYAGEFVLGLPERREKIPNFRHPQSQHTLPIFQPPPRQSMISSFPPPQTGSSFNSSHSQLPNSSYTASQNQQMPPKFVPPPMSSTILPFPSPQAHSSMYPSSQTQKVIPPFSSPQSQLANDSQWSFVTARESLSQSQSTFFDAATSFADESQISESSNMSGPPLPMMKGDSRHINVNETTKPFRMEDVMKYSTKYRGMINSSSVESWSKQNETLMMGKEEYESQLENHGDNKNANYQSTPELPPRLPRKQRENRGGNHFYQGSRDESDDAAWVHDMPTIV